MEFTSEQESPDQLLAAIPCLQCGICCSRWQPQVDDEEANIIIQGLGISHEFFHSNYTDELPQIALCLLRRRESGCIFLRYEGEKAFCSIYTFRPRACRQWTPSLFHPECKEGIRRQESH